MLCFTTDEQKTGNSFDLESVMRVSQSAVALGILIALFATCLSPLSAQPPSPTTDYVDYTVGNGSGWVDSPAKVVSPRWHGMPWMSNGPQAGSQTPYFRDTELGEHPHYGSNGSPAAGYPHYDNRSSMHGIWYRPNGYAGTDHWNQPLRFSPMGNGTPQHRSAYRLDYAPYTIVPSDTQYGPQYYPRYRDMHDPTSDDCDDPDYCRKKSFWLFGRK
ncbi:hypothetical protein OAK47_00275 [Planctomycetaceae bacterium]|nr:hypothetical protein [Planctomycetaceae bacterium]